MLTILVTLGAVVLGGTVAFVALDGGGPPHRAQPLSTTPAGQQLTGLGVPDPVNTSQQVMLAKSGDALSFVAAGPGNSVLTSQQWQADQMTDGTYVLVYVPQGTCLNAATSPGAGQTAQLSLKPCDLRLSQRWTHPYMGKDSSGRDYWQLRSSAVGMCVTGGGSAAPAQLEPCSNSYEPQQLVEFLSAY